MWSGFYSKEIWRLKSKMFRSAGQYSRRLTKLWTTWLFLLKQNEFVQEWVYHRFLRIRRMGRESLIVLSIRNDWKWGRGERSRICTLVLAPRNSGNESLQVWVALYLQTRACTKYWVKNYRVDMQLWRLFEVSLSWLHVKADLVYFSLFVIYIINKHPVDLKIEISWSFNFFKIKL